MRTAVVCYFIRGGTVSIALCRTHARGFRPAKDAEKYSIRGAGWGIECDLCEEAHADDE